MNAPTEMSTVVDCSRLLTVMQSHIGRDNGITARALAKEVGISERETRLQITVLRLEAVAICGTPSTHYFIAANAEEHDEWLGFLTGRALGTLRIVSAQRKQAWPDFINQLHLPT